MAFQIKFTPRATSDLAKIQEYADSELVHSQQYKAKLEEGIYSLSEGPERCPIERPLSTSRRTVRKLVVDVGRHAYLCYFERRGGEVVIAHIRHSARKPLQRL
jgi:plasmid stabilization system protein ParE